MYNAMTLDTARWRFEDVASPQQQSSATGWIRDAALQRLQQAYAFLPEDPTNAVWRLREVRDELQGDDRAYADRLLQGAEAARRQWLAQSAAREQQFRQRELRDTRIQVEGLRSPYLGLSQ